MRKSKILPLHLLALTAFFLLTFTLSHAQVDALHINAAGDIGINTSTPNAKLQINNTDNDRSLWINNSSSGGFFRYGLYNSVTAPGNNTGIYGIYNFASSDNGFINTLLNYAFHNFSSTGSGSMYGSRNIVYPNTNGVAYGEYTYHYRYGGTGDSYGLRTWMNGASTLTGTTYGVYSNIGSFGTGAKYGVYADVPTTQANWYAGYFNGNVQVTGALTVSSDERKKQDIAAIDDALAIVMKLSGKTYTFKEDANVNLPTEKQYGFLAQDIEKVLPELVRAAYNPTELAARKSAVDGDLPPGMEAPDIPEPVNGTPEEYKSVNYLALIPVLVEAIKEQQKKIEALEAQINR